MAKTITELVEEIDRDAGRKGGIRVGASGADFCSAVPGAVVDGIDEPVHIRCVCNDEWNVGAVACPLHDGGDA